MFQRDNIEPNDEVIIELSNVGETTFATLLNHNQPSTSMHRPTVETSYNGQNDAPWTKDVQDVIWKLKNNKHDGEDQPVEIFKHCFNI